MTNSGVFSNKKNIQRAKEAAGSMQYAAATGMEAVEAYQAQLMAAEMAKLQVYGKLGAPGTYGPGAAEAAAANPAGSVYDTTSDLAKPDQGLRQSMPYVKKDARAGLLGTPRMGILDPEAYASSIAQSSSFRTRSALTAEAEQLANREGELYNRLENSIIGVINEGAALALRDRMRDIRSSSARGTRGAAGPRNAAMRDIQEINAMESSMRQRVQQTWEANKQFQEMLWKQIDNVQEGNVDFLENLPGTNRAFMDAMAESAKMHVDAAKMSSKIYSDAYAVRQSQQPVNFWVGLAEGLVGMVGSAIVGELTAEGPGSMVNRAAEKLRAGTEYTKGLFNAGPEEGKDAEGNLMPLQGPATATGMGPIDTYNEGAMGSAWSKLLGWSGGQ
jgi:hypothetical protein